MAHISNRKLLQTDPGTLKNQGACVVIVKTEWNAAVVDELEKGCVWELRKNGILDPRIIQVPGAFELSFAIKSYWDAHKYKDNRPDAFIALGCVMREDTPHFDYICKGVTEGIVQLNLSLPVPTIFGVLTVNTQEQAEDRIGGKSGHKGEEAAVTALKMISLARSFT